MVNRVSAEEFVRLRAEAGGDLRKMRLPPAAPTQPANPTCPWLPPGVHAQSPEVQQLVWLPNKCGLRAKHHDGAVCLQVQTPLNDLVQLTNGSMLSTTRLTPQQARVLAAQLLHAAHETEKK
jgi:hypothetical protein